MTGPAHEFLVPYGHSGAIEMKTLRTALIAVLAMASTSTATVSATALETSSKLSQPGVNDCYLVAIVITADDTYYVYECYDNGDGTY